MYNEKVMDIFRNPKNVGEIKNPSGVGTVGNEVCGDIMQLYLKVNEKDVITDAKFKTFGCAAAIVSSSITTEIIRGKTIDEALKLENQEILDCIGGLPPHKIHCSILAKEAIEEAVKDYRKKQSHIKNTVAKKNTVLEKFAKVSSVNTEKTNILKTVNKKEVAEDKKETNKVKFVKSDIDELIRTSNQLLDEIESNKFLNKEKKDKKSK